MTSVKGAWDLQDVRDKQLQGIWKEYDSSGDPFTLFAWGRNTQGNLAQNNVTPGYSSPAQIPGTTWSAFSAMNYTGMATKLDGTLWAWGNNGPFGNLGLNDKTKRSSPTQIPGTTWSRPIGPDSGNAGCVKSDGTMWMWGRNDEGTVAQNNRTDYSSPKQVGSDTTWSTKKGHSSLGDMSMVAIKTDGTLWAWGYNRIYGQLGLGNRNNTSSPVQIGTNTNWKWVGRAWQGHFAINTSGELYAWGSNYQGNLGINIDAADTTARSSPVQIPGTNWKSVDGAINAVAVKTDGTLWTWGYNHVGQLGLNDRIHRSSPTQVPGTNWKEGAGISQGMGIKTDGTLWTWGYNGYGTLGQNSTIYYSSPVQVPGTWAELANGNASVMASKPA